MDDDLMTPTEVSERLRMPIRTVYDHLRTGRLPARRLGKRYLILRSEVEKLIQPDREPDAI
jgi:excisionase family DNA binding protein